MVKWLTLVVASAKVSDGCDGAGQFMFKVHLAVAFFINLRNLTGGGSGDGVSLRVCWISFSHASC